MNDKTAGRVHWSFWIIGAVMLIWNVLGTMNLLWQMNAGADSLASLPETHRAIIEGRPVWATGGFAIGVFVGALGCLLLLFRRSTAYYLFITSLLGVIVTMIHTIRVASSGIEFSHFEIFVMILMPLVVAGFLVWYSRLAISKGWIV
jgi:hypothetical protein